MRHYANSYISKLLTPQIYCGYCEYTHGKIHSDFEFFVAEEYLFIVDSNLGNRSVTNDVGFVLWSIYSTMSSEFTSTNSMEAYKKPYISDNFSLPSFKIFYRDSDKRWDGIAVDENGKFLDFYFISAEDKKIIDAEFERFKIL